MTGPWNPFETKGGALALKRPTQAKVRLEWATHPDFKGCYIFTPDRLIQYSFTGARSYVK
jgi:hypothetical protein